MSIQLMWSRFLVVMTAAALLLPAFGSALPRRAPPYDDGMNDTLRVINDSLVDIKHQVSNHETEIRTFEHKLDSQELILESIREELIASAQGNKDFLKDTSNNLDNRMATLEATTKGLVTDLKQLKAHANESATALGQYKQKLAEIEKALTAQNQHMASLESALRSIMEALQTTGDASFDKAVATSGSSPSGSTSSGGSKIYKVQSGDSLEKIAARNGTTAKAIKELNGLTKDRIFVGQNLKLP